MKKLQKNQGFTMVELLCCALILTIFSTVLAKLMQTTSTSFFSSVQTSEAHSIASAINASLSDEFRYAENARRIVDASGNPNVEYASPSQSDTAQITLGDDGKLYISTDGGKQETPLLSPSAYTKDCSVANLEIDINTAGISYKRSSGPDGKTEVRRITVSYDVVNQYYDGNDKDAENILLHESFEVIPAQS